MPPPKIFADFNNADPKGRVRLNCNGTTKDLATKQIQLRDGLVVALDDDDELCATGVVEYSKEEQCWVAVIDWSAIHHRSGETGKPPTEPVHDLRQPPQEAT